MIEPREAARLVRAVGAAMRAVGATHVYMEGLDLTLGDAPKSAPPPEETKQIPLPLAPPKVDELKGPEPLSLEELLFASSAG